MSDSPTPPNAFSVRSIPRGDALIVKAFGEIDLVAAEHFEAEVRWALSGSAASVLIDLTEVWFIDSTGLRVLVDAARFAEKHEKRFGIRGEVSPAVERAFAVSGLTSSLPFIP
jgi:anti-anti-sigma factor